MYGRNKEQTGNSKDLGVQGEAGVKGKVKIRTQWLESGVGRTGLGWDGLGGVRCLVPRVRFH